MCSHSNFTSLKHKVKNAENREIEICITTPHYLFDFPLDPPPLLLLMLLLLLLLLEPFLPVLSIESRTFSLSFSDFSAAVIFILLLVISSLVCKLPSSAPCGLPFLFGTVSRKTPSSSTAGPSFPR